MAGLYDQFETNHDAELKGVYVPYGKNSQGQDIRFLVSRMGKQNKAYSKALEQATRPHRRAIDLGTMDNDQAEEIFMKVFCEKIILGWEGVEDREGKPLKYNTKNAMMLMKDLPDLYDDLQEQAKKASLFRTEQMVDEAKN